MERMRFFLATALMIVLSADAAGAFGLSKMANLGGGSSAAAVDPDAFLEKSEKASQLVNASASLLHQLVASKEEQAKVEAMRQKLAQTSDPKEQAAIKQEIQDSEMATLSSRLKDEQLKEQAQGWDQKKKEQGTAALFNLALGVKMASDLAIEGKGMAASIQSNPMLLKKAKAILTSVQNLGDIATGAGKVVVALPPVFTAAKITVELPDAQSSTPKNVDLD